ncbi:protein Z, vitamin K-dependent plasma glycoprotein b isoform 2-T2 [Synchiropus picturatus]
MFSFRPPKGECHDWWKDGPKCSQRWSTDDTWNVIKSVGPWASPSAGVFLRRKRANLFLLEEILQGDLERECYEERCSFEEAREYFEDHSNTLIFWRIYYDGDQCKPNPCLHGGNCTDKIGGFYCSCPPPYYGIACQMGAIKKVVIEKEENGTAQNNAPWEAIACPSEGPDACQQICSTTHHAFKCSCTLGFELQSDGRSCKPADTFPCGRPLDNTTLHCPHGKCPWQVVLWDRKEAALCAGVILSQYAVLTAAHCLPKGSEHRGRPSNFHVLAGDKKIPVRSFLVHERYRSNSQNDDLALLELTRPLQFSPTLLPLCLPTKDLCENILMHSGTPGLFGGGVQEPTYRSLDECRRLNISALSNKKFCMDQQRERPKMNLSTNTSLGRTQSPWCSSSLPGRPVATVHHGTAFLTGILISTNCYEEETLVFTKTSRYLKWLRHRLEVVHERTTQQILQDPEGL